MTETARCLRQAGYVPNAQTRLYAAPAGTRTIIDSIIVSNASGGAVTLSLNLVQSGDAAGASNLLVDALSVADGALVALAELEGQVLNEADFISAIAGAADSLVIRISGREVN